MTTIQRHRTAPRKIAPRCRHYPHCPAAGQPGDLAARIVAARPEQGWNLLCNGIVTFEDTGLIVAGRGVGPHRAAGPRHVTAS